MNGWLVFGVLVLVYLGLVYALRRRAKPLPGNLEFHGPLLFWRTQMGKRAIQKVARPRRFWNAVADAGIVLTWLVGLLVFAILVYSVYPYFTQPDVVKESSPPPEFLLGIPGVNPLIPVGYGLVALLLALVIHEGSHGVMAYVADLRVKSLGLVAFVIPIGAFVEPEEEDLAKATTRQKNRLFAAGPTSNIVLAFAAGLLLFAALSNVTLANDGEGVLVGTVEPGSAAERAGLRPGDVITAVGDQRVADRNEYTVAMNRTAAGETVDVHVLRDGVRYVLSATLTDKSEYVARHTQNAALIEEARGKGFLGVSGIGLDVMGNVHEVLRAPLADPANLLNYVAYPFFIFSTGIDMMAEPYRDLFTVQGAMASLPEPLFWGACALLYWIVWINLMLGTFNALPAGPLDGGQMLRATLWDRLMKRHGVRDDDVKVERAEMGNLEVRGKDPETQAKLDRIRHTVRRTTMSLGFFILGLILLPIFGPPLLKLLG